MKATLSLSTLAVALLSLGNLGRCEAGEDNNDVSSGHMCPMYCLRYPPVCTPPASRVGGEGCWRCCDIGEYSTGTMHPVGDGDNGGEGESEE